MLVRLGEVALKHLLNYKTIGQLYMNYKMINLMKKKKKGKIFFKYICLKKALSRVIQ